MATLTEDEFDVFTDESTNEQTPVKIFTWKNPSKTSVQVINYGATVVSIKTPDRSGKIDDIVMGFDDLRGYQNPNNPYFGCTVGRIANRVANGRLTCLGDSHRVTINHIEKHQLHGGLRGFDKVMWDPYVNGTKLILSYLSRDGEEGYPGNLLVQATFELTDENEFKVDFKATTDRRTVVGLTNHSYFNLAGHGAGRDEIYSHEVCINAEQITETDAESIPTGALTPVSNTVFDFRVAKTLGDYINEIPNSPGFDDNFCIAKGTAQRTTFVSRVVHPSSGRCLEIYSNQPGVQFYTANFLPENLGTCTCKGVVVLIGKENCSYQKHGAFCLETQNWPDAPNQKTFPSPILNPGEVYHHNVIYKFLIDPK